MFWISFCSVKCVLIALIFKSPSSYFFLTFYTQNWKPLALVYIAKLKIKSVLSQIAKLLMALTKLKPTGCTFMDLLIHRHLHLRSETEHLLCPTSNFCVLKPFYFSSL